MKTIKISSISELIDRLCAYSRSYVYRGQANDKWTLRSSLERVSQDGSKGKIPVEKFEAMYLARFKAKYHLYPGAMPSPQSTFGWLSFMQHYGVPTRLLDFSESPYVALYFTLEAYNFASQDNPALFCIDYKCLMDKSIEKMARIDNSFVFDRNNPCGDHDQAFEKITRALASQERTALLWIAEPFHMNPRMNLQGGSFLMSLDIRSTIQESLESPDYAGIDIDKITFDRSILFQAFDVLRKMNISAKSLYGDLDGFSRDLRTEMSVYAASAAEDDNYK